MSDNSMEVDLIAAQVEMPDPKKDARNPHFKSKFASLGSILDAVRPALWKHGFAIVQRIDFDDNGSFIETQLLHKSGRCVSSRTPIICAKEHDPQAMGSAITYARRYGLAALCSVVPEDDDDGNSASDRSTQPARQQAPPQPPQPPPPPKPPAEPFELVEHAVAAFEHCKTIEALEAAAARAKVSKFQGEDATLARRTYTRCRDVLAGV